LICSGVAGGLVLAVALGVQLGVTGAAAVITLPSTLTNPFSLEFNQSFSAGICVVTSGATNIVVIFD
jgi:hypothetical protein